MHAIIVNPIITRLMSFLCRLTCGRHLILKGDPMQHVLAVAIPLLLLISGISLAKDDDQTALDRYVAAPDPSYRYDLVSTIKGEGQTTFILHMTSQTWL